VPAGRRRLREESVWTIFQPVRSISEVEDPGSGRTSTGASTVRP
jgi:hypothetical protein